MSNLLVPRFDFSALFLPKAYKRMATYSKYTVTVQHGHTNAHGNGDKIFLKPPAYTAYTV